MPSLVVGGADVTGNTGVAVADIGIMSADNPRGRAVHFGIREHAMGAVMNGMALHGGVLPVGGTFLVFSDYMRPSVRLAALSQAHVVYSFSHDSVGLGEDGPTHQPVEHLASLRAIPGLRIIRPADANEVAHAWRVIVASPGPTALVLSRQALPVLAGTAAAAEGVARGAYVLSDVADLNDLDIVLAASGSEVSVCVEAQQLLAESGIGARVVSLPSWDLLQEQDQEYGEYVLPSEIPVLAVEAGTSFGWERFADDVLGIDHFGISAPGDEVLARLGFTGENIAARAQMLLDSLEGVDLVAAEEYFADNAEDEDPS